MIRAAKPKDVLIEPRFNKDKTASGLLFLPETARERCTQGIVKYIGSAVTEVSIGDRVAFSGYTGTLARVGGEILIVMPEKAIDFIFTLDDPDYGLLIEEDVDEEKTAEVLRRFMLAFGIADSEHALKILLWCWDKSPVRKVTYPEMMQHISNKMKELPVAIEKSAASERENLDAQTRTGVAYA